MKYLLPLIGLLLAGCSGSPYDVQKDLCLPPVVAAEEFNQFKDSVVRDLKAIKQELTGVDTGCEFVIESCAYCDDERIYLLGHIPLLLKVARGALELKSALEEIKDSDDSPPSWYKNHAKITLSNFDSLLNND